MSFVRVPNLAAGFCSVIPILQLSFVRATLHIFTFFHDTGPVARGQDQWPYFQHVLVTGPVPDVADVLRSDASEWSPALPQDRWQYSHTDVLRSDTSESQKHETSQHRQPSACSGAVARVALCFRAFLRICIPIFVHLLANFALERSCASWKNEF